MKARASCAGQQSCATRHPAGRGRQQQQQQQQRHGSATAAATAGAAGLGTHLVPRLALAVHLQELIQQVVKLCSGVEQGFTQAEQLIASMDSQYG